MQIDVSNDMLYKKTTRYFFEFVILINISANQLNL